MSKKGTISWVKEDKIKAVYIHRNAELDRIGRRVVRLCCENTLEQLRTLYDSLILVDEDAPMLPVQKEAYRKYMPEQFWTEDLDWSTALKYTKDATEPLRDGFPYVVDYASFIPSWRNRFRYTIDLDKGMLKLAKGGLEIISQESEEVSKAVDYCPKITPCLLAEFPLDDIPGNWLEICREKWQGMQIVCLPWDTALIRANQAESDHESQHSAKAMEFFTGINR